MTHRISKTYSSFSPQDLGSSPKTVRWLHTGVATRVAACVVAQPWPVHGRDCPVYHQCRIDPAAAVKTFLGAPPPPPPVHIVTGADVNASAYRPTDTSLVFKCSSGPCQTDAVGLQMSQDTDTPMSAFGSYLKWRHGGANIGYWSGLWSRGQKC
jgi:hypothetical protein